MFHKLGQNNFPPNTPSSPQSVIFISAFMAAAKRFQARWFCMLGKEYWLTWLASWADSVFLFPLWNPWPPPTPSAPLSILCPCGVRILKINRSLPSRAALIWQITIFGKDMFASYSKKNQNKSVFFSVVVSYVRVLLFFLSVGYAAIRWVV